MVEHLLPRLIKLHALFGEALLCQGDHFLGSLVGARGFLIPSRSSLSLKGIEHTLRRKLLICISYLYGGRSLRKSDPQFSRECPFLIPRAKPAGKARGIRKGHSLENCGSLFRSDLPPCIRFSLPVVSASRRKKSNSRMKTDHEK